MKQSPSQKRIFRLCVMGVMMALYIILTKFMSIRIVNLRITFASLPVILMAMLFGPAEASVVAGVGELILQLTGDYGVTLTTPLWCLPPVVRALIVGFGWRFIPKKAANDMHRYAGLIVLLVLAAVAVTLSNTGVIWLDSIIYHYFTEAYVFGQFAVRLITGVVTAVAMSVIAIPLEKAVRAYLR